MEEQEFRVPRTAGWSGSSRAVFEQIEREPPGLYCYVNPESRIPVKVQVVYLWIKKNVLRRPL